MKRFALGVLVGSFVFGTIAYADHAEMQCQPVIVKDLDCTLGGVFDGRATLECRRT